MKRDIHLWVLLTICVVGLFIRAYGRGLGTLSAAIFVASVWLFFWALNRADRW